MNIGSMWLELLLVFIPLLYCLYNSKWHDVLTRFIAIFQKDRKVHPISDLASKRPRIEHPKHHGDVN
ncbi:hypothetical protein WR25_10223 [Diploscapter pachys]|uniref:Uncharacterized protein n=1 Tax=Diploscapter pachys TaxID=2018661 RepID=A0A2A2L5T8_9BILA|nr:hypothetical protein WR25_10223 [Diploscapter pachys]